MRPPCEFVQKEYLQSIRIALAHELREKGLSQSDISRKMSITQPAVNKYLGLSVTDGSLRDEVQNLANKLSEKILSSTSRADDLVKEICQTCMSLRVGSHICQLHRKSIPILGDLNCQICSDLLGGEEMDFSKKATVIRDMQEALRLIEASSDFPKIIPQVRANLVACDENAITLSEVAGVPGRITLVGGRARILVGPQFGTSKHTASLLLWAKTIWPHVRACLCISGTDLVLESAKKKKIKIFQTSSPASNVEEIINLGMESIGKRRGKNKFPALHIPGGIGVESVLYIFGPSAFSLSKVCIKISKGL